MSGDSFAVKEMREKVENFGSMLEEILKVFPDIGTIKINAFNGLNTVKQYDSSYIYLDLNISKNNQETFTQYDTIIDLLQSAFKESGIVKRDNIDYKFTMDLTLKNFFSQTKFASVHPMVGSPKKNLLKNFDTFIENETNYELTFSQKINRLNKLKNS